MTLVKEENVPEVNTDLDVQIETIHKVPSKRDEDKNKKGHVSQSGKFLNSKSEEKALDPSRIRLPFSVSYATPEI